MEASEIKIRASALGYIMVGAQLDGAKIPLGKVDQKRLEECLKAKELGKMTDAMKRDLPLLIKKRDTPFKAELSEGAKTHVRNMWYGKRFDYQKEVSTMEMRKGILKEDEAIEQVAGMFGIPFAVKNQKWFENDYIHGTPDWFIRLKHHIVADIKCISEPEGLDFFEQDKLKPIYEWQIIGYQWLTGMNHGMIIRVLMNPPEDELRILARALWFKSGESYYTPVSDEFMDYVRELYNFERIPIEERVKIIRCDIKQDDPALIIQQVELMREYWQELDYMAKHVNKEELNFLLNGNM